MVTLFDSFNNQFSFIASNSKITHSYTGVSGKVDVGHTYIQKLWGYVESEYQTTWL